MKKLLIPFLLLSLVPLQSTTYAQRLPPGGCQNQSPSSAKETNEASSDKKAKSSRHASRQIIGDGEAISPFLEEDKTPPTYPRKQKASAQAKATRKSKAYSKKTVRTKPHQYAKTKSQKNISDKTSKSKAKSKSAKKDKSNKDSLKA